MAQHQLSIFVSPKHQGVLNHLMDICGMKESDAELFILNNMPHLLDLNYQGHDGNGNPCKSLKRAA